MGRRHNRSSRIHDAKRHQGMDQHAIGDRSDSPERGSLCGIANDDRGGAEPNIANGIDAHNGGGGRQSNGLPEHKDNVRDLDAIRLRLSRGAAPALRRSFDAADINPILNDPDVFPFISVPGIERIDAAPLLENTQNILLMADGGGVLFVFKDPTRYEVHTNFLKAYRGAYAVKASLDAYHWMFTHTDCLELWTQVPEFNKAATRFCDLVGATLEFKRTNIWPTHEGNVDLQFWSMKYDSWVRSTPDLAISGADFHKHLAQEFYRFGVTEPHHSDEECHDRQVGACLEMIYGGQPEKAVILYNRWARIASYAQIMLVSTRPLILDIGDAILQVSPEKQTFKVLKCRSAPQ